MTYVAYLPKQNAYLLWDDKYSRWAATSDRTLATRGDKWYWAKVKHSLIQRFELKAE